jgi:hypothetical protein
VGPFLFAPHLVYFGSVHDSNWIEVRHKLAPMPIHAALAIRKDAELFIFLISLKERSVPLAQVKLVKVSVRLRQS